MNKISKELNRIIDETEWSGISEEDLDQIQWLASKIIKKYIDRYRRVTTPPSMKVAKKVGVVNHIDGNEYIKKHSWMDHCGSSGNTFISEPYDLTDDQLDDLLKHAKNNNLSIRIEGKSYHYPGHTLRITLERKNK